jgi:hypothetical protein
MYSVVVCQLCDVDIVHFEDRVANVQLATLVRFEK